jgi:hypothetical protein
MKFWILILLTVSLFVVSCGKKTVPTATPSNHKSHPMIQSIPPKKDSVKVVEKKVENDANEPVGDTVPPALVYSKVFTVVDSHGRLLMSQDKKPADVNPDWNGLNNIRSFTPNQAQTLASRFKTVPPRVIYVPAELAKKGRKGKYYIYNKKFWYWQKSDGLFYLDTNYYQ